MRRVVWITGILVVVLVLVALGWVVLRLLFPPAVVVPTTAVTPLSEPLVLLADELWPCRGAGGESGFEVRFLLIGPSGPDIEDAVGTHLRSRGYALRPVEKSDYGPDWSRFVAEKADILIFVGDVQSYLADPRILEGPGESDTGDVVGGFDGPIALLSVEPKNVTCET